MKPEDDREFIGETRNTNVINIINLSGIMSIIWSPSQTVMKR